MDSLEAEAKEASLKGFERTFFLGGWGGGGGVRRHSSVSNSGFCWTLQVLYSLKGNEGIRVLSQLSRVDGYGNQRKEAEFKVCRFSRLQGYCGSCRIRYSGQEKAHKQLMTDECRLAFCASLYRLPQILEILRMCL